MSRFKGLRKNNFAELAIRFGPPGGGVGQKYGALSFRWSVGYGDIWIDDFRLTINNCISTQRTQRAGLKKM